MARTPRGWATLTRPAARATRALGTPRGRAALTRPAARATRAPGTPRGRATPTRPAARATQAVETPQGRATPDAAGGASNAGGGNTAGSSDGADAAGAGDSAGANGIGGAYNEKSGQVLVYRYVSDQNSPTLQAEFRLPVTSDCVWTKYGDCSIRNACTAKGMLTYANAGTINLTSSAPALNVSVDPKDSTNVYPFRTVPVALSGGEMLHIATSGGEVPAFSSDLVVPSPLVIDQPVADSTGLIKVSATQDLVLSFSGGADDIQLMMQGAVGTRIVECTSTSPGTLTVPEAALAAIGSGTTLYALTVGIANLRVGDWNVLVGTVAEAMTLDHKLAVKIQIQ